MSENHSILRIQGEEANVNRIHHYLAEATRPDFADEVPDTEVAVFEAMEFAPLPIECDANEGAVTAWFEHAELNELQQMLQGLTQLGNVQAYLLFSDDEEFKGFFQYREERLQLRYEIGLDKALDQTLWQTNWDVAGLEVLIDRFSNAS